MNNVINLSFIHLERYLKRTNSLNYIMHVLICAYLFHPIILIYKNLTIDHFKENIKMQNVKKTYFKNVNLIKEVYLKN